MDIRSAKKLAGTIPPQTQTSSKVRKPIPAPNTNGTLSAPPDDLAEDLVMKQYWEFLKEHDISQEDIKNILDAIVSSGNVNWKFMLFNSVEVEFRIRPAWVDDLIIERIDDLTKDSQKVSNLRYNNLVAEFNLAASMIRMGKEEYTILTPADLDRAITRVTKLSYIVKNALVDKLAAFDRAVAVATSSWALRNFTTPRKEDSE